MSQPLGPLVLLAPPSLCARYSTLQPSRSPKLLHIAQGLDTDLAANFDRGTSGRSAPDANRWNGSGEAARIAVKSTLSSPMVSGHSHSIVPGGLLVTS